MSCVVGVLAAWFLPRAVFPAGVIALLAGTAGLMWRRPYVALSLAVGADVVADLAYGALPMQEWNLAMGLAVAISLGAFAPPLIAYAGVAVLAGSIALQLDSELLANWVWVSAVLGCVATFAVFIVRSERRAASAWTRVAELAATTPESVARRAVVAERVRLTADIHLVVRGAVLSMRGHADAAAAAWHTDPRPSLRAIQDRGRQAISELRRLLGLLRDEPDKCSAAVAPVTDGPARAPLRVDLIGAGCAVALATTEYLVWGQFEPPTAVPASWVLTVLAAATFGLRGTAPGVGAMVCGVVFLVGTLAGRPLATGIWCLAVVGALSWTAMYRGRLVDMACVVCMLGCQTVFAVLVAPDELTFVIFTVVAAGVAGFLTGKRNALTRLAAMRSAVLTAERAVASELAVRSERLSLAREVHDVVSHAVVLMVVQAGAAEALLAGRPAAARVSLDLVRNTADVTLRELDRLLAVVAEDPPNEPDHRSVHALVERMRAGGLDVALDQQDCQDRSDPTVYRIVQETLTNALRHAPRAHVEVRVARRPDGTTVEVVDDGPGAGANAHRGYGLIGMTERVRRAGGTIYTGPGRDGTGFRVCANLPLVDGSVA